MRTSLDQRLRLVVFAAGYALVALCPAEAQAQTRHITVSLSGGSGLSLGTGQHGSVMRHTPVFLDAAVRSWSSEEPNPVLGGVLRVEVDGRASIAVVPRAELVREFGPVQLRPFAGLPFFFAPFTLLGAEVGLMLAVPMSKTRLVAGVLVDAFFWGSDLPSGQAVVALNLSVGLELDVRP